MDKFAEFMDNVYPDLVVRFGYSSVKYDLDQKRVDIYYMGLNKVMINYYPKSDRLFTLKDTKWHDGGLSYLMDNYFKSSVDNNKKEEIKKQVYTIVKSNTLTGLEINVNDMIGEGYNISGSLVIVDNTYLQPMIKNE